MTVPLTKIDERVEALARQAYDRCHPDDTFEALRHRAQFSKEDHGLLRQWLAIASEKAGVVAGTAADGFGPQPQ